jgi:hypothetical protein
MKTHRASICRARAFAILSGILLVSGSPLLCQETAGGNDMAVRETPDPGQEIHTVLPELAPYIYDPKGRRDPFVPLITKGEDNIPSLSSLILTGLIWNHKDKLAILEDPTGKGYPMRIGDSLGSATLVDIRSESVVFRVVYYGEVHMHTLKLIRKEEI